MHTEIKNQIVLETKFLSYLLGFITASIVFFFLILFIVNKVGFTQLLGMSFPKIKQRTFNKKLVFVEKNDLKELTQLNAVFENCNNLTNQPQHNNFFVCPNQKLMYVLRPNVKVYAYMLKTGVSFNFDPPILHIDRPASALSKNLQTYIKNQSRLSFGYCSNSSGFRKTVPVINSERKILIVGDSVAFGVGVADENTVASLLQKAVGKKFEIMNSGVGGYGTMQAFLTAEKRSKQYDFDALIYIACQNDFSVCDEILNQKDILAKFSSIADRFDNNVILMLHTYMEYNLADIFVDEGWSDKSIKITNSIRDLVREECDKYKFKFYDWTDVVSNFRKEKKSIFAGFSLYVDHCHLSPLGNQLMAEELCKLIKQNN